MGGRSAVYLGHGWMASANHVMVDTVTLGGARYEPIAESRVRIANPDGSPTDLQLFRLDPTPPLPELPIRQRPPSPGERVLMIGYGHKRGAARFGLLPPFWRRDGWELAGPGPLRWGTNLIEKAGLDLETEGVVVRSFATRFDRDLPTPHEAQAVLGDSGGAVFSKYDGEWQLAGIIFAVDGLGSPYERVAAYEFFTYAADLSYYRPRILAIILAR